MKDRPLNLYSLSTFLSSYFNMTAIIVNTFFKPIFELSEYKP